MTEPVRTEAVETLQKAVDNIIWSGMNKERQVNAIVALLRDSNRRSRIDDITTTFRMMTAYVDSCNEQSDESEGLAIVPNIKGFKRFLDAEIERLEAGLEEGEEK